MPVGAYRLTRPLWSPHGGTSDGRPVAISLADEVLAGRAMISSPSGAQLGPQQFVDVRWLTIQAGDRPLADAGPRPRRWLFAHAPTEIQFDLVVPADAYFQSELAIDPQVWTAALGDGVRFVVHVTPGDGSAVTLIDAEVNPRARGEQRRWIDVLADLRPWAGRRVRLSMRTEPREDPLNDWAGWGEPVIAQLDSLTADRLQRSVQHEGEIALRP